MNILMTVEELAKYLKIKPDTIYKKVRKGELPAIKLGKLLRFPKELIDQWLMEQAQKTAKARELLTNKVEEVVGQVNKRAKAAQKVINADVNELFIDMKKASFSEKPETLRKGLKGLWVDLNKEVSAPLKSMRKKKPAKKASSRPKSKLKAKSSVARTVSKKNSATAVTV